jgi:hypothetical protein
MHIVTSAAIGSSAIAGETAIITCDLCRSSAAARTAPLPTALCLRDKRKRWRLMRRGV